MPDTPIQGILSFTTSGPKIYITMKHILTITLAFLPVIVFSQNIEQDEFTFDHKNSVQIELFGHGLFYSLNYERIILNKSRFKTAAQVGMSYYPPKTGLIELWIPVAVNEILSFDKHHFEMGLGYVFTNESETVMVNGELKERIGGFITGRIGYRYQKPQGRILLRAGFTPFLEYQSTSEFHPSGGLAIGYNF